MPGEVDPNLLSAAGCPYAALQEEIKEGIRGCFFFYSFRNSLDLRGKEKRNGLNLFAAFRAFFF